MKANNYSLLIKSETPNLSDSFLGPCFALLRNYNFLLPTSYQEYYQSPAVVYEVLASLPYQRLFLTIVLGVICVCVWWNIYKVILSVRLEITPFGAVFISIVFITRTKTSSRGRITMSGFQWGQTQSRQL